jgi:diguanylate cyclase (GGDEF)-like protein
MLLLQSFIAVFSLTSLILSAVIDERKEAELSLQKALENLEIKVIERTEKLQQSEAQINGFFSSAPIGMGIVDRDLRYVRVNQVLADINRKSVEEHLGATLQEVLPNLTTNAADSFYRVLETGKSLLNREFTSRVLSINDEDQTWLTSFFPIFNVNHVASYVGFVVVEISDRKKAEANMQYAEYILRQANLELEKLVNIDGLTQIANRRCFNDRLEFEWERLAREQQPLSLLLFDLDYFKRYNDYYGHQVGDDCLIKVAQATQQTVCRPADLVARYGGEEFVVILPNTDLDGAIAVANQIHDAIVGLKIPHQNSDISDIVTISLGVTSLIPDLNQAPSLLIKQADVALYSAKQQGRDRSVIFTA